MHAKANNHRGQVVVVTGASAGVGRATARALGERGASVGLIARGRDGLEGARREIEASGGHALVLPTDVAHEEQVEGAAFAVEREFGPIDVWVNCAMATVFSPITEMRGDEYKRVMEVNYLGYVYGTLAALRRMRPRDRGTIVQVSSALAFHAIPLQSAYCASKHAIVGFTQSLREELIHDGSNIQVTMVHMPALNTPQFSWSKTRIPLMPQPVPPIFQPEVAAEAILWASEHPKRDIAVGSPTLKMIFGSKVAPRLVERIAAKRAYSGQLTPQPIDPNRPNNLWQPLPGDYGAHGVFDDRAKSNSLQFEANRHRNALILGGLFVLGTFAASLLRKTEHQAA